MLSQHFFSELISVGLYSSRHTEPLYERQLEHETWRLVKDRLAEAVFGYTKMSDHQNSSNRIESGDDMTAYHGSIAQNCGYLHPGGSLETVWSSAACACWRNMAWLWSIIRKLYLVVFVSRPFITGQSWTRQPATATSTILLELKQRPRTFVCLDRCLFRAADRLLDYILAMCGIFAYCNYLVDKVFANFELRHTGLLIVMS